MIAQEPASVGDLYKNYILILAALPAVLQFLQISVLGVEVPLVGHVRLDMVAEIEDLKAVLAELDLAGLERLKGEGVKAS